MRSALLGFGCLVVIVTTMQAEPLVRVTKLWEYGYKTRAAWRLEYVDEWGGVNYWCVDREDERGLWDWKAVYEFLPGRDDPCPECNTAEYGDRLVKTQAQRAGVQLPEDMPLPTFRILYE